MNLNRIVPEEQDPEARKKNFDEVSLGYTPEEAVAESKRCIQCKNPRCVEGCPASIDIPMFIKLISESKPEEACKKIKEKNFLPGVCGRVCPQEEQCEKECVLNKTGAPINIGKLERFAADNEHRRSAPDISPDTGKKVAIVGSGPAGLTCAAELALKGHKTVIYEALHAAGGVMMYGIPEFRLPKKIVQHEIDYIKKLGVEIKLNYVVGRLVDIDELNRKYDAVFIASGAGLPFFMDLPGENLNRVYSANEYLTRCNLMKAYKFPEYATPIKTGKHTVVIGGGNVAMDSARAALRLGSKVTVVYRRTEKEMPARIEEIEHAKQEGIEFEFLTNPIKILGEKEVNGIECARMELGEKDASGRPKPVEVKASNFTIDCDAVIIAIGQGPNPLICKTTPKLKCGGKSNIEVNNNLSTSIKGVYAGGDVINGGATIIQALGEGKKAAESIDNYLSKTSFGEIKE